MRYILWWWSAGLIAMLGWVRVRVSVVLVDQRADSHVLVQSSGPWSAGAEPETAMNMSTHVSLVQAQRLGAGESFRCSWRDLFCPWGLESKILFADAHVSSKISCLKETQSADVVYWNRNEWNRIILIKNAWKLGPDRYWFLSADADADYFQRKITITI